MIAIRKAAPTDYGQIWNILKQVIAGGDTIVFSPESSKEKMLGFWCGPDKHTYVATIDGKVVGTLFIKDNQPDLGSHIANAGYLTLPSARGKGVGMAMGEFS